MKRIGRSFNFMVLITQSVNDVLIMAMVQALERWFVSMKWIIEKGFYVI